MSGTPHPRSGENAQHILAARDWLRRAEEQFEGGQAVLAAATMMLAQAELKIAVESVAGGIQSAHPKRVSNSFHLVPFTRTIVGAAALAACLIVGMAIGRVSSPMPPIDTNSIGVQIAQIPQPVTAPAASPEELSQVAGTTGAESVLAESTNPEIPPAEPARTRRPIADHRLPEAIIGPILPAEPSPGPAPAVLPSLEPPKPVETVVPVKAVFHPAEVALETIRVLSERLLEGNKK